MADQTVWAACHQLRVSVIGSASCPMCMRAQIADTNPTPKRTSLVPAHHRSVLRPLPWKVSRADADQEDHDGGDDRRVPQLAGPRDAALFMEKAATSQYSQNVAHPVANTNSTARIVTQTATVASRQRREPRDRDQECTRATRADPRRQAMRIAGSSSPQRANGRSVAADCFRDREGGGRGVAQESAHFAVVAMHH